MDATLRKLLKRREAAWRQLPSDSAFRRYFRANAEIWRHLVGSSKLPLWGINDSIARDLNHDGHVVHLEKLDSASLSYPSYRGEVDPPIPGLKEIIIHRSPMERYFPLWALDIDWIFEED